jgi:ferredoxin
MRVRIVDGRCQGHARCAALFPEMFDIDENGYGIVRPGREVVPDGDLDAQLAADNCPEQAIELEPDA